MTMTQNNADPAQVLAAAMIDATETHGGLHDALADHAQEVAGDLIAAIRANTKSRAPDIVRKFMQRMTLESSLTLCISQSR
jgi:hypothetical protein